MACLKGYGMPRFPVNQPRLRLSGDQPSVSAARFNLHHAQVFALTIAAVAIKEGHQIWPGEGCCATPPINGEGNTSCGTAARGRR
jgi:hypothetical protein